MTNWRALLICGGCALALALESAMPGAQQQTELIIRNGLIVTAEGRTLGDVRIRGEQVAEIGANLAAASGAREIDAKGMILMPGAVDTHTHLNAEPPAQPRPNGNTDDYVSGSSAGFAGGATTLSNFVPMLENETPAAYADRVKACDPQDRDGRLLHPRGHGQQPVAVHQGVLRRVGGQRVGQHRRGFPGAGELRSERGRLVQVLPRRRPRRRPEHAARRGRLDPGRGAGAADGRGQGLDPQLQPERPGDRRSR